MRESEYLFHSRVWLEGNLLMLCIISCAPAHECALIQGTFCKTSRQWYAKALLIVSVHPHCACKFTCQSALRESTLSNKRNNDGAALAWFKKLGHSVTPIFLFMDQMKKIHQLKVWFFCKIHHWIMFFLALY